MLIKSLLFMLHLINIQLVPKLDRQNHLEISIRCVHMAKNSIFAYCAKVEASAFMISTDAVVPNARQLRNVHMEKTSFFASHAAAVGSVFMTRANITA